MKKQKFLKLKLETIERTNIKKYKGLRHNIVLSYRVIQNTVNLLIIGKNN